MSSTKLVKVVHIVKDSLYWGANNKEEFKAVEAIEESGWWMTRVTFYVNKSMKIYDDVSIGTKLCVKVDILEACSYTSFNNTFTFPLLYI